ncbi:MAG TPA: endonuclease V [Planctomicrobium sp.]|nr:endonuclease V [Planctomicrobium sp.]
MSERVLTELNDLIPNLHTEVEQLLAQIPHGRVTTYGDLARVLGDENARSARWLGEFLNHHPHHADCRCYRVVRSNGEVGLFVEGDPKAKGDRLQSEGVDVSPTGKVDLSRKFTDFVSSRPLEAMRIYQKQLAESVSFNPPKSALRSIAGVDVAYADANTACAAYVQLDLVTLEPVFQATLTRPVRFPYIPGYLTFRELPVLLELCLSVQKQQKLADVLFVDGNGQLHPWRAGIATCLGISLDHPTIGIGKSLLCGRVDSSGDTLKPHPIIIDEKKEPPEIIGMALPSAFRKSPCYVSVGHRMSLELAVKLALQSTGKRALPEPIYLADRLTKQAKRQ